METSEVQDILYRALKNADDSRINDVTSEMDNDSGEIILTTDDGKRKQCWVIRQRDLTETDPPDDDDPIATREQIIAEWSAAERRIGKYVNLYEETINNLSICPVSMLTDTVRSLLSGK